MISVTTSLAYLKASSEIMCVCGPQVELNPKLKQVWTSLNKFEQVKTSLTDWPKLPREKVGS